MPTQNQNHKRAEVLVARSKRTGERYPVRTSHLAGADNNRPHDGRRAGRFHYPGKDKRIVCQCRGTSHSDCRQVHNAEIEDLCHEFFLMYPMATTCSREQWRAIDTETTETAMNPSATALGDDRLPSKRTSCGRDSFEYDSLSVVELLAARDRRSFDSGTARLRPAACLRSSYPRSSSLDTIDKRHLSNGPHGVVDVPEDVWRVSRPSVYLGQHNTGSFTSTPLGSSIAPMQHGVQARSATQTQAPELLFDLDSWYGLAHNPGPTVLDNLYEMPHESADRASQSSSRHRTNGLDVAGQQISFSEISRRQVRGSTAVVVDPDRVAELPSSRAALEVDPLPPHLPPHHSPTLQELESRDVERVSGLADRKAH